MQASLESADTGDTRAELAGEARSSQKRTDERDRYRPSHIAHRAPSIVNRTVAGVGKSREVVENSNLEVNLSRGKFSAKAAQT
jgi:hypothetical protein